MKRFQIDNELEFKDGKVGRETLRALDAKFIFLQEDDKCNFRYSQAPFDRKEREAFLERHIALSDRPMARKIIRDLCDVTPGHLSFSSEEELRREVVKRLTTSKLLQESQTTGAFGYPEASKDCPGHIGHALLDARVNKAARNLWKGPILETRPFVANRHYFFELTAEGKKDAYNAVKLLFTPQSNICDQTLIHCDSLITLVHTLAFADSMGKDVFNELVKAGKIGVWLTFDGMSAKTGDKIPTPVAISTHSIRPGSENDLLIGDHVIFWNHLAYDAISLKNPGPWRLENAILVDKNKAGQDLYEGHGAPTINDTIKPGTKEQMLKELVENYNFYVRDALPLTKRVDAGDAAAEQTLAANYPQIEKKKDNLWHVNELDRGRNSSRSVRSYFLREIKDPNDPELIGLRDPDNPNRMNTVRRPRESM